MCRTSSVVPALVKAAENHPRQTSRTLCNPHSQSQQSKIQHTCPPLECECSSRSSSSNGTSECIVCSQQVTFVQRFPCLNCNKALVTAPLWWCSRRMGDGSRVTVNRIGLLWFRLALTGNSLVWREFN